MTTRRDAAGDADQDTVATGDTAAPPDGVADQDTVATQGTAPGPAELVLVRHAESLGNIADREARAAKAHRLELPANDEVIELSDVGQQQAAALAEHLAGLPEDRRPTVVVSSPYRRARATAERALEQHPFDVLLDERLRERELGILDGFTSYGIRAKYPDEAERRDRVGKFYYRPPGGESWADVVLRIRSLLVELQTRYPGERVWIFSHEAVILAFRYVIEGLDAERVVALQKAEPLANCSMTRYADRDGALTLVAHDDVRAVVAGGTEVTREQRHADEDAGAQGSPGGAADGQPAANVAGTEERAQA